MIEGFNPEEIESRLLNDAQKPNMSLRSQFAGFNNRLDLDKKSLAAHLEAYFEHAFILHESQELMR